MNLPLLQQTQHLRECTWEISFLLNEPPDRCYVRGRADTVDTILHLASGLGFQHPNLA